MTAAATDTPSQGHDSCTTAAIDTIRHELGRQAGKHDSYKTVKQWQCSAVQCSAVQCSGSAMQCNSAAVQHPVSRKKTYTREVFVQFNTAMYRYRTRQDKTKQNRTRQDKTRQGSRFDFFISIE